MYVLEKTGHLDGWLDIEIMLLNWAELVEIRSMKYFEVHIMKTILRKYCSDWLDLRCQMIDGEDGLTLY